MANLTGLGIISEPKCSFYFELDVTVAVKKGESGRYTLPMSNIDIKN